MANDSCRDGEKLVQLGYGFTMIQPIGDHTESQSFRFGYGLLAGLPVDHDTWQLRDLGNPATVLFAIDFDLHPGDLQIVLYQNAGSMSNVLCGLP